MKRKLVALALVLTGALAHAQVGEKLPKLEVEQWYNSPPIAQEQLGGRAVLIEVFRTW